MILDNLLANVSEVVGNPSIICNRVPEGTATLKKNENPPRILATFGQERYFPEDCQKV
jgi:hypothetical protein